MSASQERVNGMSRDIYSHFLLPIPTCSVLINLDLVGEFGDRKDDVVFLGKCDDVVRELAKELGWEEELQKAWEATADAIEDTGESTGTEGASMQEKGTVQNEVDKLTEELGKALVVSSSDDPDETKTKGEGQEVLQIPEGKPVSDSKSRGGASDPSTSPDNPKSQ